MWKFDKIHFILNEFSTHGNKAKAIIENKLNHLKNIRYKFYMTTEPNGGVKIISQIASTINPTDLVVAVGGDGTLSEIINGMVNNHITNPLALIPTGSGNDFARDNNIPRNIDEAVDYLFNIKGTTELDLIKIQADDGIKYSINSCGMGIDGRVIHSIESTKSNKTFGKLVYLWNAFKDLFSQEKFSFTITIEGETFTVNDSLLVLLANNGYFGGGVHIHPETNNADGLIDILYVENIKLYDIFVVIFQVLFTKKHLAHKKIKTYRAQSSEVHLHNKEYCQIDGEPQGYKNHQANFSIINRKFWI